MNIRTDRVLDLSIWLHKKGGFVLRDEVINYLGVSKRQFNRYCDVLKQQAENNPRHCTFEHVSIGGNLSLCKYGKIKFRFTDA